MTLIEYTGYYKMSPIEEINCTQFRGWPGTFEYTCIICLNKGKITRYFRAPHLKYACNKCLKQEYKNYIDNLTK